MWSQNRIINFKNQKMKHIIFSLIVFITLGLFTSCDDDDNETPGIIDFATGMEGIYRGNLTILAGEDESAVSCRINLARVDDGNVTLNVRNFSYKNISYGDLETQNIQANIENGKYTLKGSSEVDVVINKRDSAVLLNIDGTISGTVLRFTGSVALGDQTSVEVQFYGLKLAATSDAEITGALLVGTEKVNIVEKNIFFTMPLGTTNEQLKSLTPEFKISQGATLTPTGAQDFSDGKMVEYKVTSADKNVVMAYHVACVNGKYDFENWIVGNPTVAEKSQYIEPVGYWGTSNSGLSSVMGFVAAYKDGYNVTKDAGRLNTMGAKIVTKNTIGSGGMIPKITSGTLFFGEFVTDINEPLNSTHFGIPVVRKPLTVKGFYNYKPGEEYYHCADPKSKKGDAVVDVTRKDSCAISAVLYKAGYILNGTNLLVDNENIIAKSILPDNKTVGTNGQFQAFVLTLTYGTNFDPAQKYKLAVVFASSKNGDKYSGAPNSTLIIDDVEIVFE